MEFINSELGQAIIVFIGIISTIIGASKRFGGERFVFLSYAVHQLSDGGSLGGDDQVQSRRPSVLPARC